MRSRLVSVLVLLLFASVLVPIAPAADPPGLSEAPAWSFTHGRLDNHRTAPTWVNPLTVAKAERVWRVEAGGHVTGTPAFRDGVVYFADWGGSVHAVRAADGSRVWRVDNGAGVDSSLAVDEARVYVGDKEGYVTAYARETGELVWRKRTEGVDGTHLWGSPVIHGDRLCTGVASDQTDITYEGEQDFRGSVVCFEAATGKRLWQTYFQPEEARGVSVWSTPAIDPALGLMFVGTGNAYGHPTGDKSDAIVALRLDDGEIAWSFQATKNDAFDGRGSLGPDKDFGASPLLFEVGDRPVVGGGDKGGWYYALDRRSGELVWKMRVDYKQPGAVAGQNEGFLGSAAFAGGLIYAPTTARSMVHAIDARTGEVRWTRELNPMPEQYGDRMFGSATAANGVILQGNAQGRVFALSAATGEALADLPAGGAVQGGISLAGDHFFVPDVGPQMWGREGGVTAFRVPHVEWKPTGNATFSPPDNDTKDPPAEGGRVSALGAATLLLTIVVVASIAARGRTRGPRRP